MLFKGFLDMPAVIELLQLNNLTLRVERHQVHEFHIIGFVWMRITTCKSDNTFQQSKAIISADVHSPCLVVGVSNDSMAAQQDSPPPIIRLSSSLSVSIFRAAVVRA